MGPGRGYSQTQDKHSVAGYKREEIAMEPVHSQRWEVFRSYFGRANFDKFCTCLLSVSHCQCPVFTVKMIQR